jgi:tetratricopeptide (TPR) repeat protein
MKRRSGAIVFATALICVIAMCGAAWLILPDPVGLIPLQIRLRLPEEIVEFITTPIPTALPAPLTASTQSQVTLFIPELPTNTSTPSPTVQSSPTVHSTLQSTPTLMVTDESIVAATNTPSPSPTAKPTLTPAAQIDGLEIIAQEFNNCGPANLTMVLNYFHQEVDQIQVGNALKPDSDDRNVSPNELAGFVRDNTQLEAQFFSGGDIGLLKRLLAAGFPVIIEKGFMPSESLGWMGHYLTLFGFDDTEEAFIVMDSYLGPWDDSGRNENYELIEDLWEHFNNTFIVVFQPEDLEDLQNILGSDFNSPNTMWQNSAVWAQGRIEEEPENPYAWFNLGTSLTELGESTGRMEFFENAVIAYDRAREIGLPWRMLWYQFKPYTAYLEAGRVDEVLALTLYAQSIEETHLYRGHALLASGDTRGAEYAYRRALELNPHFSAAEEALNSISQ